MGLAQNQTSDRYQKSKPEKLRAVNLGCRPLGWCSGFRVLGFEFRRASRWSVYLASVLLGLFTFGAWLSAACAHPLGFSSGSLRFLEERGREGVELELVLDAPTTQVDGREAELVKRVREEVHLRQRSRALPVDVSVLALGSGAQGEDIVRVRAELDSATPLELATAAGFGELVLQVYRPHDDTAERVHLLGGTSTELAWVPSPASVAPNPGQPAGAPARGTEPLGGVAESSPPEVVAALLSGFRHILPLGLDHVAFVLGLFFVSSGVRALALDLTLFTLAHSLTLALGALNLVRLNSGLIEPLIALSISAVALEPRWRACVGLADGRSGVDLPRRALVFLFGLVHGLGFASVFVRHVAPGWEFLTVLLGFNLGVELGQVVVVLIAAGVSAPFRRAAWYSRVLVPWVTALIGILGGLWFIERLLA